MDTKEKYSIKSNITACIELICSAAAILLFLSLGYL